jgi:hypothetical protein
MRILAERSVIACVASLLAACALERIVNRLGEVQLGMTRDEVVAILGESSSRWPLHQKFDGMQGESLQWGDGLSSLASSAVYRGKPDRAYRVDFDRAGKVADKAAPTWVEQPEQ